MKGLAKYIKETLDRFGCQISISLLFHPRYPTEMEDCPECDPLNDDVIDAGSKEQ